MTIDITKVEQLALEYSKLGIDIDALTERRQEIASLLTDSLPVGTTAAGSMRIQVSTPQRLDAKALEAAYPVAQHPELYKPAVNLDAVKAHIAPIELDKYKTTGRPQVKIS